MTSGEWKGKRPCVPELPVLVTKEELKKKKFINSKDKFRRRHTFEDPPLRLLFEIVSGVSSSSIGISSVNRGSLYGSRQDTDSQVQPSVIVLYETVFLVKPPPQKTTTTTKRDEGLG